MKKLLLASCVLFLILGSAVTARADLVVYSTTGYFQDNLGNQYDPPSGFDQLTISSDLNLLSITSVPTVFDMQPLSFVTGPNAPYGWTTPIHHASWDLTINGVTQTVGQDYYVNVDSFDTLYLLAAPTVYFNLGSDNGGLVKLTLLGQTLEARDGILNGFIKADINNPVPIPASLYLLGTGLFGLFGIRRKIS